LQNFFRRHAILFGLFLPFIMASGTASPNLAIPAVAVAAIYLLYKQRHDSVIVLLFIILTLGDSRMDGLYFVKNLRTELMVIIVCYSIWEISAGRYTINRLFLFFVPFLFIALMALIFSPILEMAISKTIAFTLLYFMGLHYIFHRFREMGIRLLADIMYTGHLVIFAGLLLLPIAPTLVSYGGLRFNGLIGNPNGLGIYVVLLSPLTLYVFKRSPAILQRYKTLAWIGINLSLAICSSRNAILSVTTFWLLYTGLNGTSFRTAIFLLVLLPSATLIIYNIDLQAVVEVLGLERYLRLRDIENGSGRVYAWQHALDVIETNPLIGCGFACEEYHFLYQMSYRLWATGHQGGVHNSYLAFVLNTGFAGLLFYLGFVFALVRRMGDFRFYLPFVVACGLSATFESWLFSSLNAFHIYFLTIIVFCIVDATQHALIKAKIDHNGFDNPPYIPYLR
jgi:O-antigen ligase